MSAQAWEQYDASTSDQLWNEIDNALNELEEGSGYVELPEVSVLTEQIGYSFAGHQAEIITPEGEGFDPETDLRCECGEHHVGRETYPEHLAYLAAQDLHSAYGWESLGARMVNNARTSLRDAFDRLSPRSWRWADTVREMGR